MTEIKPFSLYQFPNRPSAKRMMIIGEAPGEDEARVGIPFVGASGDLLNELLQASGFTRGKILRKGQPPEYYSEFHVTNVFSERPPENDLKLWTRNKTELRQLGLAGVVRLPPLNKRHLLPEYEVHVARLNAEIAEIKPELIIALGGTALWALTGDSRITQARGSFFTPRSILETASAYVGTTAIASFHPAAILRMWDNRPILWADLAKARKFINGTLPPPMARKFWINPTLGELEHVYHRFETRPVDPLDPMGVDIETDPRIDQITTISFGFADECICIPFYDKYALPERCNYWSTPAAEAWAWQMVRRFGELPHHKAGQNFLYDHQYLLEQLDIRIRYMYHDTAILQHSLQPELPKALGVLASLYLNEPSWKFMRESTKDDNKADD